MNVDHLDESRHFALALPDAERFTVIREFVKIQTEHMINVSRIVENMLGIRRGTTEAPCLIVTAPSNHGKSVICNAVRGMEESWRHKVRYVNFVKTPENIRPLENLMRSLGLGIDKFGMDINLIAEFCTANDIRAFLWMNFKMRSRA